MADECQIGVSRFQLLGHFDSDFALFGLRSFLRWVSVAHSTSGRFRSRSRQLYRRIRREPTMNGEATARHLQKGLDTYPDVPLLLLLDRASWHGGPAARALLAANRRLELL